MSDPSESDDRRNHPRVDLVLKVEYPNLEGFLRDYTVNLSRGGTLIRLSRKVSVGDYVKLCLSFPGLLSPISRRGVVRWLEERSAEDLTAGVEFDPQGPEDDAALNSLVERIRAGDKSLVAPVIRILVVEDNPHVARLICDGLSMCRDQDRQPQAFATRRASDGKEALSLMEREPFDLLLVDMYLPVMDGESLIREARKDARWKTLPIIALSAGGDDAYHHALAAGADFFLDKPIRLADVLSTMRRLMAPHKAPHPAESGS